MTRHCPRCDLDRPVDLFITSRPNCRPCRAEIARAWRATPSGAASTRRSNAKAYSTERRNADRLRQYGLTVEAYESLLAEQGGVCAICGQACASGRRLAVDHDRSCCDRLGSCGECVRGLLCARCNAGIAQFRDDQSLLAKASAYLEVTRARTGSR